MSLAILLTPMQVQEKALSAVHATTRPDASPGDRGIRHILHPAVPHKYKTDQGRARGTIVSTNASPSPLGGPPCPIQPMQTCGSTEHRPP